MIDAERSTDQAWSHFSESGYYGMLTHSIQSC